MSELSQLNTAVLFTNWTQEDFTCKWGGNPFLFKARTSEWISVGTYEHNLGLAKHFAKHLTDRELNNQNVPTDHFTREEYEKNCFIDLEHTADVPVLEVEIHADTGLVKAVKKTGVKNPKTGDVKKVKEVVIEEVKVEEVVPEPLKTVVEKPAKAKKEVKGESFED